MSVGALWDALNDPHCWSMPQSTIEAFKYVVRQNDPERLHAWLARRSPDERAAFKKMLEAK
jgi:hypothetical protein